MAGLKGLKKKRRVQVVVILAVALMTAFGLVYFALGDGINYFRSPSQIVEAPPPSNEVFRIGGLVEEGSLKRGDGESVRFSVTDGGATVPVVFSGILPDLFSEGEGMVGTGSYDGQIFVATEILAKHDETYMPKEVVDALKAQGVYVEPES